MAAPDAKEQEVPPLRALPSPSLESTVPANDDPNFVELIRYSPSMACLWADVCTEIKEYPMVWMALEQLRDLPPGQFGAAVEAFDRCFVDGGGHYQLNLAWRANREAPIDFPRVIGELRGIHNQAMPAQIFREGSRYRVVQPGYDAARAQVRSDADFYPTLTPAAGMEREPRKNLNYLQWHAHGDGGHPRWLQIIENERARNTARTLVRLHKATSGPGPRPPRAVEEMKAQFEARDYAPWMDEPTDGALHGADVSMLMRLARLEEEPTEPTISVVPYGTSLAEKVGLARRLPDGPRHVAQCVLTALNALHKINIGHHRVSARSVFFRHGVTKFEKALTSKPKKKVFPLILGDYTAARWYPHGFKLDWSGEPPRPKKRAVGPRDKLLNFIGGELFGVLPPIPNFMPQSVTCRSYPWPTAVADARWEGSPWNGVGGAVPGRRGLLWGQQAPETVLDDRRTTGVRFPCMGPATDIWDTGMMIAELANLPRPTDAHVRTNATISEWLRGRPDAKDADLLVHLLEGMLRINPTERKRADQLLLHPWITKKAPKGPVQWTDAGYVERFGVGGSDAEEEDEEDDSLDAMLKEDLLLPCPPNLCHAVYADHQRLVAENRKLKAQLRNMAALIRQAAGLV